MPLWGQRNLIPFSSHSECSSRVTIHVHAVLMKVLTLLTKSNLCVWGGGGGGGVGKRENHTQIENTEFTSAGGRKKEPWSDSNPPLSVLEEHTTMFLFPPVNFKMFLFIKVHN